MSCKTSLIWWRISKLLTNYVLRTWTKGAERPHNNHGRKFPPYLIWRTRPASPRSFACRHLPSLTSSPYMERVFHYEIQSAAACRSSYQRIVRRRSAQSQPAVNEWRRQPLRSVNEMTQGGNGYYTAACAKTTCTGVKIPIWPNWAAWKWQTSFPP